jgi:hypothetical protein
LVVVYNNRLKLTISIVTNNIAIRHSRTLKVVIELEPLALFYLSVRYQRTVVLAIHYIYIVMCVYNGVVIQTIEDWIAIDKE